jgi:hypothetical protein
VRLDSVPRAVLILLSLGTCAVRVQARTTAMPDVVTEVNSCLRMVRVVASRRGGQVSESPIGDSPFRFPLHN